MKILFRNPLKVKYLFNWGLPMLMMLYLLGTTRAFSQARTDTTVENKSSWYVFPTLFYTPETSLGAGGAGIYFFALDGRRPSSIQADLSGTLNGQYSLNFRPEFYRISGKQRIFGDIALSSYPDQFFGIGPETTDKMEEEFSSRYLDLVTQFEQQVVRNLYVGLRARIRYENVFEVKEEGILDNSNIDGREGSTISGVGPVVTLDKRDRIFYPHRGLYGNFYSLLHTPWLGSEYNFNRFVFDLRKYSPLYNSQVLALQAYLEAVSGQVPFSIMPELGGPLMMRGYLKGRFRDNVFATIQSEWRFPIKSKFKGALFGSVGTVTRKIDAFRIDNLEFAGGIGIRYQLNDEGVHVRLDYALGLEGGGFYITSLQPF